MYNLQHQHHQSSTAQHGQRNCNQYWFWSFAVRSCVFSVLITVVSPDLRMTHKARQREASACSGLTLATSPHPGQGASGGVRELAEGHHDTAALFL